MARYYVIGGVKFYRRSLIKLGQDERNKLNETGNVIVKRAVEWPLASGTPDFEKAYVDVGGTDIWGPGPYLKVPNHHDGEEGDEVVNRVFCPWGYPPDQVRLSRSAKYLELVSVDLVPETGGAWNWLLKFEPWQPGKRVPASNSALESGRARKRRAAQRER